MVSEECFDGIIEFVSIKVSSPIAEHSMDPVGVGGAISVFVVVDDPESISKSFSVNIWVQGIFGGVENANSWSIGTSELLLSQIF